MTSEVEIIMHFIQLSSTSVIDINNYDVTRIVQMRTQRIGRSEDLRRAGLLWTPSFPMDPSQLPLTQ